MILYKNLRTNSILPELVRDKFRFEHVGTLGLVVCGVDEALRPESASTCSMAESFSGTFGKAGGLSKKTWFISE